jgi:hypothetical protein
MLIHKCVRCYHEWGSRMLSRPDRCAGCHAKYWWRPKRVAKLKLPPNPVGRPRRYQVDVLNVGQAMTVPAEDIVNVLSFKQCVEAHARKTGKKFVVTRTLTGYRINRTL